MIPDNRPGKRDFDLLREFTDNFCTPKQLPVSFFYGEEKICGIPWESRTTWKRIDSNLTFTTIQGTDPATQLEILAVCEQYADFPILEWTVYVTNRGMKNTPPVRELLGIDTAFAMQAPLLQYGNGDAVGNDSFSFFDRPLTEEPFEMQPSQGRCCDGAFPYMRILSPHSKTGLVLSIGWPGQWKARLSGKKGRAVVQAGQAETDFYLRPGETVRTPRITLMAFAGDERRAANLWRRWYMAHVIPKNNGSVTKPMLIIHGDQPTAEYPEHTGYTQENIEKALEAYEKHGVKYNAFWLDAGWYDCGKVWQHTGTWEERQPNYPEGMLGVEKRCAAHGAELILWFEPERVYKGTRLAVEHPEWLLKKDCDPELQGSRSVYAPESSLFDMGNPRARAYITDLICEFIQKNRIAWYRQDYNIWPLKHWQANEEEGRLGMLENQYIQGYLQFWDEILRRNPGIQIDACASGGRRNDLETMRRSVPLHYSDIGYGNQPVKMGFEQTMHDWMPYFKSHLWSWEKPDGSYENNENYQPDTLTDAYTFYTSLAPAVTVMTVYSREDECFEDIRRMQDTWRRAADLMLHSDFYPLTSYHKNPKGWWCRQFDSPESGEGFLLFVTGNRCEQREQRVYPCFDETAEYVFENEQTGERRSLSGEKIAEGFAERLAPRSGSIWFYSRRKR